MYLCVRVCAEVPVTEWDREAKEQSDRRVAIGHLWRAGITGSYNAKDYGDSATLVGSCPRVDSEFSRC